MIFLSNNIIQSHRAIAFQAAKSIGPGPKSQSNSLPSVLSKRALLQALLGAAAPDHNLRTSLGTSKNCMILHEIATSLLGQTANPTRDHGAIKTH